MWQLRGTDEAWAKGKARSMTATRPLEISIKTERDIRKCPKIIFFEIFQLLKKIDIIISKIKVNNKKNDYNQKIIYESLFLFY